MTNVTVFIDSKGTNLTEMEAVSLGHWHTTQMLGFLFGEPQHLPVPNSTKNIEIVSVLPTNFKAEEGRLGVHVVVF